MTGGRPAPSALFALEVASQDRDDPLFESWLRRLRASAARNGSVATADEPAGVRHARIEQFAAAYLACSSSGIDEGPPADRTWSSVRAVAIMRRSLLLERARDGRRAASVEAQDDAPPRVDAIASLEAETWGAFLLAFLLVELSGRLDSGELDGQQRALLRLVAPVTALATGRQAVAVVAEAIEWAGDDGRGEAAGLPQLLRDALGLATIEGRGNVLALDAPLPADLHDGLAALMGRVSACLRGLEEPRLVAVGRRAVAALERAALWLESGKDREVLQAGACRLALTFARGLQLALLCEHAQWMMDHGGDRRGYAAALRHSRLPVDLVHEVDPELDRVLLARQ